jgi:hypothetical protein
VSGIRRYNLKKYWRALLLRRTRKMTGRAIARRLRLNSRTVCAWLYEKKTYGAVRVRAYHLSRYKKALKLMQDSEGKLSDAAIARRLGLKYRTVSYWLKKERLLKV